MKTNKTPCIPAGFAALLAAFLVTGCAGTKVLDEPIEFNPVTPLAIAADQNIGATLDWVIVRDGPGTWARNADWDEYLLRVQNLSGAKLDITAVNVVDSLGSRIASRQDRNSLVDGSRQTVAQYGETDIEVKAGIGSGTLVATGTVAAVAAYTTAASLPLFASVGTATTAGIAGGILLGPAVAVGGVLRWRNNRAVNNEIIRRHSPIPMAIAESEITPLTAFFPLAPSPRILEIAYRNSSGEHILELDISAALAGLHINSGG